MPALTPNPEAVPRQPLIPPSPERKPATKSFTTSLVDHLEELRFRILKSLVWVAAGSIAGWMLSDRLISALAQFTGPLIFVRPTEAFMVKLKIAVVVGLFLAIPAVLYHFWRYIGIALTVKERRVMFTALPFSYLLFAAGIALGWFFILPTGMRYLTSFASNDMRPMLTIDSCFDFCTGLTLGMGLLFQLPVVVTLLAHWGIINSQWLSRYRRHAIIGIFLIAGIVTPGPDVVSQLMLALPTWGLFEVSILLARAFGTKKDL